MTDYNWCHGPSCHTIATQSRVRGSGTNKVLRTRRIRLYNGKNMFGNGGGRIWDYFCNHQCLMDYMTKHAQAVISIAPRSKALETPIKIEKEKYESHRYEYNCNYNNQQRVPYQATRTIIKSIDNA